MALLTSSVTPANSSSYLYLIYCSVASPPDPVATVMSHETVRHGETVYSEAGVSNSAESRYQDTGIQLAAAPPPYVPGIFTTVDCTVVCWLRLLPRLCICCTLKHHHSCFCAWLGWPIDLLPLRRLSAKSLHASLCCKGQYTQGCTENNRCSLCTRHNCFSLIAYVCTKSIKTGQQDQCSLCILD